MTWQILPSSARSAALCRRGRLRASAIEAYNCAMSRTQGWNPATLTALVLATVSPFACAAEDFVEGSAGAGPDIDVPTAPPAPGDSGGADEPKNDDSGADDPDDPGDEPGEPTTPATDPGGTRPVLPPGPSDAGAPPPSEPQVPGDPEAGLKALLTEGYVSCGLPEDLFNLSKPLLGPYADGEPLPWREGKNAEVPYNWTIHTAKSGVEIASMNCLECHAGRVNGELMIGLGTADMDFTVDLSLGLGELPQLNLPGPNGEELAKFVERYNAVGQQTQTVTIGTNPATTLGVLLASHHDRDTLEWSNTSMLDVDVPLIPVDTPPWWRMAKRGALFYNGMARGDHRGSMMFASSLCTDSVDEAEEILSYFNDIGAYIRSIEPPAYPFPIDEALAAAGEPVFMSECAGCHGTYSEDPEAETYRNLLIPYQEIGTDPEYALAADGAIGAMAEWFNESFYGETTHVAPTTPFSGYVAPPLDGIWATAPYLHNGSVPTLEHLLDSETRPTYWRRLDYDSAHYDRERVGWPVTVLNVGHDVFSVGEHRYIYDTTIFAHGNGGHTYGDKLDNDERRALLEYLKTI